MILKTIAQLRRRITERFPDVGLANLCGELHDIARDARKTSEEISRPMWGLRVFTAAVILGILVMMGMSIPFLKWETNPLTPAEFVSLLESLFNDLIKIGAAIFFLVTVETRYKRRRALQAVHRLRSIAHIIDMHQLTKDPDRVMQHWQWSGTESSPKLTLTPFELGRYLDYCTEMLSLTGKVAALYVERFPDAQAVGAVNELESLTTGLSRKIWQKIMILNSDLQVAVQTPPCPPAATAARAATSAGETTGDPATAESAITGGSASYPWSVLTRTKFPEKQAKADSQRANSATDSAAQASGDKSTSEGQPT